MKMPPSPKTQPFIGHLKGFKTDPIQFMLDAAENQGDLVLFKLLNKKIYFLNHPDYVKHILQSNHKNYHKSPGYKHLRHLGGMGIFTSDGEQWLKQRKLYQPAFSAQSIQNYASIVIQNTNLLLDSWPQKVENGEAINISRDMMKVTMGIISESLFSNRINYQSDLGDALSYALEWINDRALKSPFIWPAKWPTSKNRKFSRAVADLDAIVYKIIADKTAHKSESDDLLSRFMNPGEGLEGLNPQELRDEVMTIFIAGHETSANVLMWAFYELSRNPEIEATLFDEVNAIGNRELTYADLHQLHYTAQVLNETMRLYPPVWHLGRMNLEKDEIGGYEIPAGSHLRISPLVLHRHPDFWENPNQFDPDRFSAEASAKHHPFAFIPFGAGPRLCAGRNFAMMEMVLILAKIVRQFKIVPHQNTFVEIGPLMTLRPKEDVKLRFVRR